MIVAVSVSPSASVNRSVGCTVTEPFSMTARVVVDTTGARFKVMLATWPHRSVVEAWMCPTLAIVTVAVKVPSAAVVGELVPMPLMLTV